MEACVPTDPDEIRGYSYSPLLWGRLSPEALIHLHEAQADDPPAPLGSYGVLYVSGNGGPFFLVSESDPSAAIYWDLAEATPFAGLTVQQIRELAGREGAEA